MHLIQVAKSNSKGEFSGTRVIVKLTICGFLYGGDEQVSAVHEFGHIIGCRHPGEPGGEDEYTEDEDSLMGLGMELRPIYFAAWAIELSEHLPQNGPYGVGEPQP